MRVFPKMDPNAWMSAYPLTLKSKEYSSPSHHRRLRMQGFKFVCLPACASCGLACEWLMCAIVPLSALPSANYNSKLVIGNCFCENLFSKQVWNIWSVFLYDWFWKHYIKEQCLVVIRGKKGDGVRSWDMILMVGIVYWFGLRLLLKIQRVCPTR